MVRYDTFWYNTIEFVSLLLPALLSSPLYFLFLSEFFYFCFYLLFFLSFLYIFSPISFFLFSFIVYLLISLPTFFLNLGFSKFSGAMCARGVTGLDELHSATNEFLGHFVDVVYQFQGDGTHVCFFFSSFFTFYYLFYLHLCTYLFISW